MKENWINKYIGIEYEDKGRNEKLDCWGIVKRVYIEELQIDLPSFTDYESAEHWDSVAKVINEKRVEPVWDFVKPGKEQVFDVAIFNIGGFPVHTGVVCEKGKMLHIEKGINACVVPYLGIRWGKRLQGFYRHKGLKHG